MNATFLIAGRIALVLMMVCWMAEIVAAQDASAPPPEISPPPPAPPPPPPPPPPSSEIELNFVAGAWVTRVNGEALLGASPMATELEIQNAFNLDEHRAAFNGELAITKGNLWELKFSGFEFEANSSGTFDQQTAVVGPLMLDPGDAFNASFEMTSIAVEFCAWLWQPYCVGPMDDGRECRVALRAGPVLGLRAIDLDYTVEVAGEGTAIGRGEWLVPYAGFQFEVRFDTHDSVPLIDWLNFEAGGAIGPAMGGDHGAMVQLHTGMTAFFTPNFGAGLGYRLLELDVGYDDFEFTGGLQGVFVYGMLRF